MNLGEAQYYWFRRLMRRLLFKTIYDLALMLDRMLAERNAVPTAGVVDSQSVRAPPARRPPASSIWRRAR